MQALIFSLLVAADAPLVPVCDGGVLAALSPGGARVAKREKIYHPPTISMRDALAQSVRAALDGELRQAVELAADAEYVLCIGSQEESELLFWHPLSAAIGHASFVVRRGDARALIVEVPHPISDYRTLPQGLLAFSALRARALLVAGAHRCAADAPSGCDGATDACGAPGPFRASDAAHALESTFQIAHEAIADRFASDVVLSLHGMNRRGLIVSDGTPHAGDEDALAVRFARAIAPMLGDAPALACNAPDAAPRPELCGTSNIQGRHVNRSPAACIEPAERASGRFLHLEQSPALRRNPRAIIDALDRVLP
jgi:hypothetical protein